MFQHSLAGKNGSSSAFGSWKTVPAVPVPLSVSGKTVPTVPVSGSGSVPEPPCFGQHHLLLLEAHFSDFACFHRFPMQAASQPNARDIFLPKAVFYVV